MKAPYKRMAHMPILEFTRGAGYGLTWKERIDLAENEAEVLDVARDYLASLEPPEIALLPERCKPRKLFDAADLGSYAFDLAREHTEEPQAGALVHRMAALFVHANIRLSQIIATGNDHDGSLQESA